MKSLKLFIFLISVFLVRCKKEYETIPSVRFRVISTPVNASINSMAFPKSSLGFAVCANGSLLKTTNSGSTWSIDSTFSYSAYHLTKIIFPDSLTGYILATDNFSNGHTLKSTNSGSSWTENTYSDPEDISFPTASIGYMLTSTYQYKTTNGGLYWNAMNFPSSFEPSLISFANKDTGFVRDFDGYLYITQNGGVSWTQQNSPLGHARQIRFKSSKLGYAIDGGGNIYSTSNGVDWATNYTASASTAFQLLAIDVYGQTGIAVGENSIVVSRDQGQTWEFRRTDTGITPQATLKDIHMINEVAGIACAENGSLYRIELGDK